jgi:cytochrome c-type biogenesis protein CcmH/NrfG
LENSEKNLNFAAHSYLEELRGVADHSIQRWMAIQAKDLFTRSLALNPANDSAKVGLGSTYFFGGGGDAPPMEGIMAIREVAERDSNNMFAQFMLGYGGMISGQLDKAAERFEAVTRKDPGNMEAVFLLAETYERLGEKEKAVRWYETARTRVTNPEIIRAIDEKIKTLK